MLSTWRTIVFGFKSLAPKDIGNVINSHYNRFFIFANSRNHNVNLSLYHAYGLHYKLKYCL